MPTSAGIELGGANGFGSCSLMTRAPDEAMGAPAMERRAR